MKYFLFSLCLFTLSVCAIAQDDSRDCRNSVLSFLPAFEGYYLSDYCKYAEAFSYDFVIERNSRSITKEGVYREIWYKRKSDNNRHISGPQILTQQSEALKSLGGETVAGSDGSVFKLNVQGKEYWIFINANTYSEDLDNYGVISIQVGGSTRATTTTGQKTEGTSAGVPGPRGLQGPQGIAGPTGPQGLAGPQGPAGIQGPAGPRGPAGPQGPAGASGIQSSQAGMGIPGAPNPSGTVGSQEINVPAGAAGIPSSTDSVHAQEAIANSYRAHTIGEHYGGGIVFFVYDNGQHGLIAANQDQVSTNGVRWHAGTFTRTMASAWAIGGGKSNTAIIVASQGYGDGAQYAALVCNQWSYTVDGVAYGDWYLPSRQELNLMYLQKAVIGNLFNGSYWSSEEVRNSSTCAWSQNFVNGEQRNDVTKDQRLIIRSVRSF